MLLKKETGIKSSQRIFYFFYFCVQLSETIVQFIVRYDGLYKVVKYYPEKGKSGFIVWRYLLRRDDNVPAPWTKEGKLRIASLGLEIIVS